MSKIKAILNNDDPFNFYCDIKVSDATATIGDFFAALNEFGFKHLADCKGCDGCCHERAPLTYWDIEPLSKLIEPSASPIFDLCSKFATIHIDADNIVDIILYRPDDDACNFLNTKQKFCTIWQNRPLVCQSYFCLPQSALLQDLRSAIINLGENELIRLLLLEDNSFNSDNRLQIEDYPAHPALIDADLNMILVKDIVDDQLWQSLL